MLSSEIQSGGDGLETEQNDPLQPFLDEGWIKGVLHVVKSGKEATVCCCEAGASTGTELLAAKVYRSRNNRGFKNDAIYQEGRMALDTHERRAVKKMSRFGRTVQSGEWINHEWETLRALHAAGAAVPQPYAQRADALLMEYVGDRECAGAPLYRVSLDRRQARGLFEFAMGQVELWLTHNRVHADLSPYNVLVMQGRLVFIDFPQAVDPRSNSNALALLERDIANLCRYWSQYGVRADAHRISRTMWSRYIRGGSEQR
jgi:RIO kinase 1